MSEESEKSDSNDSVNISRLREMSTRGKAYREDFETQYFGETLELVLKPVISKRFLPIAALLEDKMDMEPEEAQEQLEEDMEAGKTESIDPSNFDEEFIKIMSELSVRGIDRTQGFAEGETEDGLREIFAISDDEDENIGMIGGVVLEIAERVLSISSDAEKAESFRRDGGGE
jgi:hypothetical protein